MPASYGAMVRNDIHMDVLLLLRAFPWYRMLPSIDPLGKWVRMFSPIAQRTAGPERVLRFLGFFLFPYSTAYSCP